MGVLLFSSGTDANTGATLTLFGGALLLTIGALLLSTDRDDTADIPCSTSLPPSPPLSPRYTLFPDSSKEPIRLPAESGGGISGQRGCVCLRGYVVSVLI